VVPNPWVWVIEYENISNPMIPAVQTHCVRLSSQ